MQNPIGAGVPNEEIYLTAWHRVQVPPDPEKHETAPQLMKAKQCAGDKRFKGKVCEVTNDAEFDFVYHIVLKDETTLIEAHGMLCESLQHKEPGAKPYLETGVEF